jgi:hypothetical protein
MSKANPLYVGRGDRTRGWEVVYTIPEIKVLLRSQPDDAQRWLITSQMGWALTRERNEITNEKDKRDCKPVARCLGSDVSSEKGSVRRKSHHTQLLAQASFRYDDTGSLSPSHPMCTGRTLVARVHSQMQLHAH